MPYGDKACLIGVRHVLLCYGMPCWDKSCLIRDKTCLLGDKTCLIGDNACLIVIRHVLLG